MGEEFASVQMTWVQFLGWEDPLEEGLAAHSSILAWRIPWTDKTGRLQSIASQTIDMKKSATLSLHACTQESGYSHTEKASLELKGGKMILF